MLGFQSAKQTTAMVQQSWDEWRSTMKMIMRASHNQEEIELLQQGSSSIRQEIRILRGEEEEEEPGRKGAGRGFAPSGCCCCWQDLLLHSGSTTTTTSTTPTVEQLFHYRTCHSYCKHQLLFPSCSHDLGFLSTASPLNMVGGSKELQIRVSTLVFLRIRVSQDWNQAMIPWKLILIFWKKY